MPRGKMPSLTQHLILATLRKGGSIKDIGKNKKGLVTANGRVEQIVTNATLKALREKGGVTWCEKTQSFILPKEPSTSID